MEGNSAAVALERFGRAPHTEQSNGRDADALSAATAVQRLMLDKSAGPAKGRGNAALLPRPTPPYAIAGETPLLALQPINNNLIGPCSSFLLFFVVLLHAVPANRGKARLHQFD